jgi:hypothetical protein
MQPWNIQWLVWYALLRLGHQHARSSTVEAEPVDSSLECTLRWLNTVFSFKLNKFRFEITVFVRLNLKMRHLHHDHGFFGVWKIYIIYKFINLCLHMYRYMRRDKRAVKIPRIVEIVAASLIHASLESLSLKNAHWRMPLPSPAGAQGRGAEVWTTHIGGHIRIGSNEEAPLGGRHSNVSALSFFSNVHKSYATRV